MDPLMGNKKSPGRRSGRGSVRGWEAPNEDGVIIAGFSCRVKKED